MSAKQTRRRPGGARPDGPLLEQSQIIEAALALTRRRGLDGMSMRKLGDELGVTSMAIYWYFANKDELVDAVINEVFARIELPDTEQPSWQEQLRQLAWAVHEVLVSYPGVADQILTYQNYPPSAVPLVEYGVAALRRAGFGELEAAEAFNVLASVVVTQSHFQAYQRLAVGRPEGPDEAVAERIRQGWLRLNGAIDHHVPHAHSYVSHLDRIGVGGGIFARALDVVMAGLEAQPRQRPGP